MQLADYISNHHEVILAEWEAFARTLLPAAAGMSKAGLRDHADEILTAIVHDMGSLQDAAQQSAKSKGEPSEASCIGGCGELGQLHAVLRIESGFTLSQVVAEYRALRASVFRLWGGMTHGFDPEGAIRFNEAIDEALAEAIDRYTEKTNQYRDQLIGIVSHDLRNPLGGILMGASVLTRVEGLDDTHARVAAHIADSAKRMVRIVDDLLDLTRTRLGAEIPIARRSTDIGPICRMVISELEGSHPSAVIRYASKGDLRGEWDSDRLAQVFSNLVANALQHGDVARPIVVVAEQEDADVVLRVQNRGPTIPEGDLGKIFEPSVRSVQGPQSTGTGLGLGLFIAKQLVTAHGGTIDVSSTDAEGTTFVVRLPRNAEAGAGSGGPPGRPTQPAS